MKAVVDSGSRAGAAAVYGMPTMRRVPSQVPGRGIRAVTWAAHSV